MIPRSTPNHYLRIAGLLVWLVFISVLAVSAKTKFSAGGADYVAALASADRFLHAWQTQDQETGLLMLTDNARQRTSEDRLRSFFAPPTDTQQGYEISRGKKLALGHYTFPVTLFVSSPEGSGEIHRRVSQIVVVKTGKNDWGIDKLP